MVDIIQILTQAIKDWTEYSKDGRNTSCGCGLCNYFADTLGYYSGAKTMRSYMYRFKPSKAPQEMYWFARTDVGTLQRIELLTEALRYYEQRRDDSIAGTSSEGLVN